MQTRTSPPREFLLYNFILYGRDKIEVRPYEKILISIKTFGIRPKNFHEYVKSSKAERENYRPRAACFLRLREDINIKKINITKKK